ncbi:MAG: hypothetical protein LBD37_06465 [Treponema sp.]|jgi:tetratricopeptide (TPR) repeat protein|nr:hypothetical protein [Treponema sp.]
MAAQKKQNRAAASKTTRPRVSLSRVCLLGALTALGLGGGIIGISLYSGRSVFSLQGKAREGAFYQKLREFDQQLAAFPQTGASAPAPINRLLDDLARSALGVESHLSVLKRRRNLALRGGYFADYRTAAEKTAAVFPHAEPIAAAALESLIREALESSPARALPLEKEAADRVRSYASVIRSPGYEDLVLSAYVLSGALETPQTAVEIPQSAGFLSRVGGQEASPETWDAFFVDRVILRFLRGEIRETSLLIQSLLAMDSPALMKNPAALRLLRFGAEFLYDFGDPALSAEFFSRFSDDPSTARQGDALWLAGRLDAARTLWTALVSPDAEGRYTPESKTLRRSLYNLGSAAPDKAQSLAFLERLMALEPAHPFGAIRYSRFLETPQALSFLETPQLGGNSLPALEQLRRGRDVWPIDKMIPETWLLLNRYPQASPLYQWGAYYFELQKRFHETARLIRAAEINGVEGYWIPFAQSLQYIREGRYDAGEALLKTIPPQARMWQADANIGLILEAKRSPASALEYYTAAAGQVSNNREAARLRLRIARCLRALGRDRESREALEYAGRLDGENPAVRMELRRVTQGEL